MGMDLRYVDTKEDFSFWRVDYLMAGFDYYFIKEIRSFRSSMEFLATFV